MCAGLRTNSQRASLEDIHIHPRFLSKKLVYEASLVYEACTRLVRPTVYRREALNALRPMILHVHAADACETREGLRKVSESAR